MLEICHQVLQLMTGHHRDHGSTPAFANGEFFVTKCQCLLFRFDRRPVGRTRRRPISFPEPAIPWEGNGGSGIIRDRHTKNCMSLVLRMRFNKPQ